MNQLTAIYLARKVKQSLAKIGMYVPEVDVYDSALDMMQGIWPTKWEEMLKYYKEYVSKGEYVAAYSDEDGELKYHKQVYHQPSLNNQMCLLGLATNPVSVTHEGCGMMDFTFTVFHEIAHILYETRDEVTCNSFALLYNNLLWASQVSPTAEKE
jgi:hypothetical protein